MLGDKFNDAVRELENFFVKKNVQLVSEGWAWYPSDEDAPCSLEGLKKCGKLIPISTEGNDTSVYNWMQGLQLRFWHDVTHAQMNTTFHKEDELKTIKEQLRQIEEAGLSTLAQLIFTVDMVGQVLYYDLHKEYVMDQEKFVFLCLLQGMHNAIQEKV